MYQRTNFYQPKMQALSFISKMSIFGLKWSNRSFSMKNQSIEYTYRYKSQTRAKIGFQKMIDKKRFRPQFDRSSTWKVMNHDDWVMESSHWEPPQNVSCTKSADFIRDQSNLGEGPELFFYWWVDKNLICFVEVVKI